MDELDDCWRIEYLVDISIVVRVFNQLIVIEYITRGHVGIDPIDCLIEQITNDVVTESLVVGCASHLIGPPASVRLLDTSRDIRPSLPQSQREHPRLLAGYHHLM